MSTVERAFIIATDAHAKQKDKAGAPYIMHPLRVAASLKGDEAQIVGLLHDVVEDSLWTLEQIAAEGFSPAVVAALDAVTHREGEDYEAFVRRAAADPIGRLVKRADLLDNMDTTRLREMTERDRARLAKYRAALAIVDQAEC